MVLLFLFLFLFSFCLSFSCAPSHSIFFSLLIRLLKYFNARFAFNNTTIYTHTISGWLVSACRFLVFWFVWLWFAASFSSFALLFCSLSVRFFFSFKFNFRLNLVWLANQYKSCDYNVWLTVFFCCCQCV